MNDLFYYLDICPDFIKNKFIEIEYNTFDKILKQNDEPSYVYIVKKGKVKVYSLAPSQVKFLENIYCEYNLFGELEIFANKPILNYVEAMEHCEVIKISKDTFIEWIKYDSEFSLYINIQLSTKMYHTSVNSKTNVYYPLKARFIFFVWNFLNEHKIDSIHKDILVEGLGSNIRSINRVIRELVKENIIECNKGFIKVNDMDKLVDKIFPLIKNIKYMKLEENNDR